MKANSFSGRARILVFGSNDSAIGAGTIAEVQLNISTNAPAGSLPVVIAGVVASDTLANAVNISGIPGNVMVFSRTGAFPPFISTVSVSGVTGTSAKISWKTNILSNSEVEYWTAESASRRAILSRLETDHALELNRLKTRTTYYFRVKSSDSDGNQAVASGFSFNTSENGLSELVLPRLTFGGFQEASKDEVMTGMALANLAVEPATVTFTSLEGTGDLTEGQGVTNPRVQGLNPGSQLAVLDREVFGKGYLPADYGGWIKLASARSDIYGFFLVFDSDLGFMDGANFSGGRMTDFAFVEIQKEGHNRISIANNSPSEAFAVLSLIKDDGSVRDSVSSVIAANGALTADLFDDLFSRTEPGAGDYVRVRATQGLHPFLIMQQEAGDITVLAGQDLSAGSTSLYSPQYVIGGAYRTSLSLINLDSRAGTVQLRFMGEDGRQLGATQYLILPASGKLHIDDQQFFLDANPENMVAGYVEIISDGIRLAGSTLFGNRNGGSFSSGLALISELHKSVIFSHVASDDLYFTGIAILNPGANDANATLELFAEDGTRIETVTERIPRGQKKARLLSEQFRYLSENSQTSGYVRLTSDQPVASFSLFGTNNLSILSAVPPQVIQ